MPLSLSKVCSWTMLSDYFFSDKVLPVTDRGFSGASWFEAVSVDAVSPETEDFWSKAVFPET